MKNVDESRRRNQTYSIDEKLIIAIRLMSAMEVVEKGEIVRNALDSFIPKKYIDMAEEQLREKLKS